MDLVPKAAAQLYYYTRQNIIWASIIMKQNIQFMTAIYSDMCCHTAENAGFILFSLH